VDDRAVELVQVAQFLEGVGDRGVGEVGHVRKSALPAPRMPSRLFVASRALPRRLVEPICVSTH
jgi:hypothetical protein